MENFAHSPAETVVQQFFAAQQNDKLEEAPLHPNFKTWVFSDPNLPTGGFYEGLEGIKLLFGKKIPSTMKLENVEIKRYLHDGNSVMVLGYLTAEAISSKHPLKGQKIEEYFIMHFFVEGDKITELRDYPSHHPIDSIPGAFDLENWEKNRLILLSLYERPKDLPNYLHDNVALWCYGSYKSKLNAHLLGKTDVLTYYMHLNQIYDISNRKLHEVQSFNDEVTITGVCEATFKEEDESLKGKRLDFYFINKAFFRDGKIDKIRIVWGLSELNEFPLFVGVEDSKERLVKFARAFYDMLGSQSPETVANTMCSESMKMYVLGPGEFAINGAYYGRKQFINFLKSTKEEFETVSNKDKEYRVTGDNTVMISGVSEGKVLKEGHIDHGKTHLNYWINIFIVQDRKIFTFINKWSLQEKGLTPDPFKR